MTTKLPLLPMLLARKIYKTGQTRGADDDVIFQNRVGRNSTVLIPFSSWKLGVTAPPEGSFKNGLIVLITPEEYFEDKDIKKTLEKNSLKLGHNAVVFYETREQWQSHNPKELGWKPAENRTSPLKGKYVARVPATTATMGGSKIIQGFSKTKSKGAGIRVFEYASDEIINQCKLQLEALFWHCYDSTEVLLKHGMRKEDISLRKEAVLRECEDSGLLDYKVLSNLRIIDPDNNTVCPLCLKKISSEGFFDRMTQATGREVPDLTVTEINLFHIKELTMGEFNHRPYNLTWGHHHCNVVTRDNGIEKTLSWMKDIIKRNTEWELSKSR
jgi:hypothetical protein